MKHYQKAIVAIIRKPEKKELTKIYILSARWCCIFRVTSFEGKIKKKIEQLKAKYPSIQAYPLKSFFFLFPVSVCLCI